MINQKTIKYSNQNLEILLCEYISNKTANDKHYKSIAIAFILSLIIGFAAFAKPLLANTPPEINQLDTGQYVYLQKNFEENIKNKYAGSYIHFYSKGIAHIKQTKYINSKPIRINIVELNTNINPNLKIKPQIASTKLNNKSTVRKIAQKNGAIIAINGGFFKPQTGVPLGALMIDGEVLTGAIYNRVALGIFEDNNKTYFKMDNIDFDIKAYTKSKVIKIDNINQPRMLSTHTLLYTSIWGDYCPIAAKKGWNILIQGNKIIKVSANPIKLEENSYVISAPIEIAKQIIKDKEIYININLQDEFKNASHIIGAGPYLVKNSQIYVDVKTQKLEAISGKNPRSAIGFKNDGTFIIVTIDGREEKSVGMTLFELAKYMKNLGCEYAMNFDGGSSSAMYVNQKIVNGAINKEGIAVSNALVVSEIKDEIAISSL